MRYVLLVLSLAVLAVVYIGNGPDCNDPDVWSTELGVQMCSVPTP